MYMADHNYFELFDIPVSFRPDLTSLKKKYFALSRKYHPDYVAMKEDQAQQDALAMTGWINKAYATLSDTHLRTKYIIGLYGLLSEEDNQSMPQAFLMEMMDINESIMDLQMDFDASQYKKIMAQISLMEENLQHDMDRLAEQFEIDLHRLSVVKEIKDNYLKSKYLLRIRENVATFAHH